MENLQKQIADLLEKLSSEAATRAITEAKPDLPKYIDDNQFCEMLGIHRNTALKLRQRGEIPYYKRNGRVRYDLKEVQDYMETFKIR